MRAVPHQLPRPRLRRRRALVDILETVALIIAIWSLVDLASLRFYIDGPSMLPGFESDQRVIVSRLNYMLEAPERGDIVVFYAPGQGRSRPPLIKRLIGLPGETVRMRDGAITIDGRLLHETWINEPCRVRSCVEGEWTLGMEEYFLMGDNRNRSNDSRSFGPVRHDQLVGEAVLRYWPLYEIGLLDGNRFPADPFSPHVTSEPPPA